MGWVPGAKPGTTGPGHHPMGGVLTVSGVRTPQCQTSPPRSPRPPRTGRQGSGNGQRPLLRTANPASPSSPLHCHSPWEQLAVELLHCTAILPRGSGPYNPCNALPHCLGAMGCATSAMHCLTAWGQRAVQLLQCTTSLPRGEWAVQLMQCTATLLGGCWQCNSYNTPPHCLGAAGSRTSALHCLTA